MDDADLGKTNTERTPQPVLIELNGADSATLVAIRGIGPLTAGRVIRYRDAFGWLCLSRAIAGDSGDDRTQLFDDPTTNFRR